jgi:hypothetical protein
MPGSAIFGIVSRDSGDHSGVLSVYASTFAPVEAPLLRQHFLVPKNKQPCFSSDTNASINQKDVGLREFVCLLEDRDGTREKSAGFHAN